MARQARGSGFCVEGLGAQQQVMGTIDEFLEPSLTGRARWRVATATGAFVTLFLSFWASSAKTESPKKNAVELNTKQLQIINTSWIYFS